MKNYNDRLEHKLYSIYLLSCLYGRKVLEFADCSPIERWETTKREPSGWHYIVSDAETPVMDISEEMRTPLLPFHPGPLWHGVAIYFWSH